MRTRTVPDMGLFSRGQRAGRPVQPGGDEELDHQSMAIELLDAFTEHDAAGLAGLDAAGRAEQARARWALYWYVDRVWDDAKDRGLNRPSVRTGASSRGCVT
jgi:hypothetical protein